MARPLKKAQNSVVDYTAEFKHNVLGRLPPGAVNQGTWKVYRETPARNGGTIWSYCGPIDYAPDADLEDALRERFEATYGGGLYELRLHDHNRTRIESLPAVRIALPGAPIVGDATGAATATVDLAEHERKQNAYLQIRATNLSLQKQIEKMEGQADGDPLKLAVVDVLKKKLADEDGHKDGATSPRDLLELAMVMKAMREPEEKKESGLDKAVEGIMGAVTGLVSAQASMNASMMQTLNAVMQQSVNMMSLAAAQHQQDPWIVAIDKAPELLDRVVGIVREVKDGYIEVKRENAAQALANPTGQPVPRIGQNPPAAPAAPASKKGNRFLAVVHENYKANVPPDTTADQVQYFLSDEQLSGVLAATPDQVVSALEREGLKRFFDDDPKLRDYVRQVVVEIQTIYRDAAARQADKEKAETPAAQDRKGA